jgi:hypothetical protein
MYGTWLKWHWYKGHNWQNPGDGIEREQQNYTNAAKGEDDGPLASEDVTSVTFLRQNINYSLHF